MNETKKYEQPLLEIIGFDGDIKMVDASVEVPWPWGVDEHGFFEE